MWPGTVGPVHDLVTGEGLLHASLLGLSRWSARGTGELAEGRLMRLFRRVGPLPHHAAAGGAVGDGR